MGGIGSFHIQGGRVLRIPQIDGFLYGTVVRKVLFRHLGQDIVGGPIQYAHHALDSICSEAFTQGAYDRDASPYGSFKDQVDLDTMKKVETEGSLDRVSKEARDRYRAGS